MALISYGNTPNFGVSYDSSFTGGAQPDGPALAQGVLDYCEYDLVRLTELFGVALTAPVNLPIQINLQPGAGGAQNNLANAITVYCNTNSDPKLLPGTVVIEAAEIFMAKQPNHGWNPVWSSGEALSRVCAQILYPENAWLSSTGTSWYTGAGSANWVDNVNHTDTDIVSTGCGAVFLNYLAYQRNFRWPDIIQAPTQANSTLAQIANNLGVANPWADFMQVMGTYLPTVAAWPTHPTAWGPQTTDDLFPVGPLPSLLPQLYLRHNLADDGTSHTGSLSDSPDIIVKNSVVANPQATYSTAASIASDTESDAIVLTGRDNDVYLRAWNRGSADAHNTYATVYWSPPSTLVTPNLWTEIGSAYLPNVPVGQQVQVSDPGVVWPADHLPGPGHYCFVATVGNAYAPAPTPTSFASFDDFVNYIYANNNITWRNFNVGNPPPRRHIPPWWQNFHALPFLINGAWDMKREFALEVIADLPEDAVLALEVPHWLGAALQPRPLKVEQILDPETDPHHQRRLRISIPATGHHSLGRVILPAGVQAASHLLVRIPDHDERKSHKIAIRQIYQGREVGRVSWLVKGEREVKGK